MADEDHNEGLIDKAKGRAKQTIGDVTGDDSMKQQGSKEENRGEAREELEDAKDQVAEKAQEVENRE